MPISTVEQEEIENLLKIETEDPAFHESLQVLPIAGQNFYLDQYGLRFTRPEGDPFPPFDEILVSIDWLGHYGHKTKTINKNKISYGLKNAVERWAKNSGKDVVSISNGAFIAAVIIGGYRVEPVITDSTKADGPINVYLNIGLPRSPADQAAAGFPVPPGLLKKK